MTLKNVRCLVAGLSVLILCGCEKKDGNGPGTEDPAGLCNKIADDHKQMMEELANLLKEPAPDVMRPKLTTLKDKYIRLHVASGKLREAFTPELKKTCDGILRSALFNMKRDHLKVLQEVTREVRKQDNDLANELASFNTLTQYAAYELLKKQLPKEAKRLGIQ